MSETIEKQQSDLLDMMDTVEKEKSERETLSNELQRTQQELECSEKRLEKALEVRARPIPSMNALPARAERPARWIDPANRVVVRGPCPNSPKWRPQL